MTDRYLAGPLAETLAVLSPHGYRVGFIGAMTGADDATALSRLKTLHKLGLAYQGQDRLWRPCAA